MTLCDFTDLVKSTEILDDKFIENVQENKLTVSLQ